MIPSEVLDDSVPHQVRLGKPVQGNDGRPFSCVRHVEFDPVRSREVVVGEALNIKIAHEFSLIH